MFKCESCKHLKEALEFERARNKDLTDRVMALADARAYHAVKFESSGDATEYYGGKEDVTEVRNEFGEKVLVKINNERPI